MIFLSCLVLVFSYCSRLCWEHDACHRGRKFGPKHICLDMLQSAWDAEILCVGWLVTWALSQIVCRRIPIRLAREVVSFVHSGVWRTARIPRRAVLIESKLLTSDSLPELLHASFFRRQACGEGSPIG